MIKDDSRDEFAIHLFAVSQSLLDKMVDLIADHAHQLHLKCAEITAHFVLRMTAAAEPEQRKTNVRNRVVICVETTARGHILCDRTGAGWTPLLRACRAGQQRFCDIVVCLLFHATASQAEFDTAQAGVRRAVDSVAQRGELPVRESGEMVFVPWFLDADCKVNKMMLDVVVWGWQPMAQISSTRRRLRPEWNKPHERNASDFIFFRREVVEHITTVRFVDDALCNKSSESTVVAVVDVDAARAVIDEDQQEAKPKHVDIAEVFDFDQACVVV
jgi:hypothetical protein